MRVKPLLSFLVLPALFLALAANGQEQPRLTFKGLGEIRIGMTPSQAKKLGFQVTTGGPWGEVGDADFIACHYLDNAPNFPDIALMVNDGRVVRIDVTFNSSHGWQSYSGAKIGMSETTVANIYGRWLKTSGHPYLDEAGSYLTLKSSDGRHAMTFETSVKAMDGDGLKIKSQPKYVTDFRAGLASAVGYIEGCA